MAELPGVAIVIPAFNASATLERAVRSIWATGYPRLEIAIVDDGSTDGTLDLAETLCAERPSQARLHRHAGGENRGVSSSRNLGVERTSAEWVAFLDADDWYLANRFDCLAAPTAADVDAWYGTTQIREEEGGHEGRWYRSGEDRFGVREPLTGTALLARLLEGSCWATSAITVRRMLLARSGGFDPQRRIAEDCHLWFRLAALGRLVPVANPEPVSVYARHAGNTYRYRPEHRVAMLDAMLDGWRWARVRAAGGEALQVFAQRVPAYALRSIVAMREAGRPDLALKLLRLMRQHSRYGFLLRPTTVRQALSAAREIWRHQGATP